jgi:hypothetical protein
MGSRDLEPREGERKTAFFSPQHIRLMALLKTELGIGMLTCCSMRR